MEKEQYKPYTPFLSSTGLLSLMLISLPVFSSKVNAQNVKVEELSILEKRERLARLFLSTIGKKLAADNGAPDIPAPNITSNLGGDQFVSPIVTGTLKNYDPVAIVAGSDASTIGIPENNFDDILILQGQIDKYLLSDMIVIYRKKIAYVGLGGFVRAVDFPLEVLPEQKRATGWFRRENMSFKLDVAEDGNVEVIAGKKQFSFSQENILFEADDIYVPAPYIDQWFGTSISIQYNDLIASISSEIPLPLEEKIARAQGLNRFNIGGMSVSKNRVKNTPYKIADVPFVDFEANSIYSNNSNTKDLRGRYSALGYGDLAHMSSSFYIGGNDEKPINSLRVQLFRQDKDNNLLGPLKASYVGIGDIGSPSAPIMRGSGNGLGVRIGNRSIGATAGFETTNITGNVQPGWDIELYRNNSLISSQKSNSNGLYEFKDVPLFFGDNDFEIILYGPQGQIRKRTHSVPLTKASLATSAITYDVSLQYVGKQIFSDLLDNNAQQQYLQLSGVFGRNFRNGLSINAGYQNIEFKNGEAQQLVYSQNNLFIGKGLISANVVKNLKQGYALDSSYSTRLGNQAIRFKYSAFYDGFRKDSDDLGTLKDSKSVNMSGLLFNSGGLGLNYSVGGAVSQFVGNGKSEQLNGNITASYKGMVVSNNVVYNKLSFPESNDFENMLGFTNLTKSFGRFRIKTSGTYSILPKIQVQSIANTVYWADSKNRRYQVGASYSPRTKKLTASLGLIWDTKHFSVAPNLLAKPGGNYEARISLKFGLGNDPYTNSFHMINQKLSGTGAVAARVFEDLNSDGKFNEGEPLIEGAEVKGVQARKSAVTKEDGIALIMGLRQNNQTDIELDSSTLADPFWITTSKGIAVIPRPGNVETIDIPIVTSSEVEGTVQLKLKSGNVMAGQNIPLHLDNIKGETFASVNTAYDGYYIFMGVPPGLYILSIDKDYLKERAIEPPMPLEVRVSNKGESLILDEIVAKKEGAERFIIGDITPDNKIDVLDLGSYKSPLALKIVWIKARQALGKQSLWELALPMSDGLIVNNEDEFQLFIKPTFDNNNPSSEDVCQKLSSINIQCRASVIGPIQLK